MAREFFVEADCETVLIVLKILHHSDKENLDGRNEFYTLEQLVKLHDFAATYKMPLIRSIVKYQMSNGRTKEYLKGAMALKLGDVKSVLLDTLPKEELFSYLDEKSARDSFSSREVVAICQQIFPTRANFSGANPIELGDAEVNVDRWDWEWQRDAVQFHSRFPMFDYKICTSSKALLTSKSFLAMYSGYFRTLFFGESNFKEKHKNYIDHIEDEYKTYKLALEILAHRHKQGPGGRAHLLGVYHLVPLYRFADMYDFPALRDFVKAQLLRHRSKEALDAAMELELHDVKATLLERVSPSILEKFMKEQDPNVPLFTTADVEAMVKNAGRKRKHSD